MILQNIPLDTFVYCLKTKIQKYNIQLFDIHYSHKKPCAFAICCFVKRTFCIVCLTSGLDIGMLDLRRPDQALPFPTLTLNSALNLRPPPSCQLAVTDNFLQAIKYIENLNPITAFFHSLKG